MAKARAEARLPPAPRDPALDDKARAGMAVILAGLPEGVAAIDRIEEVAKLPLGLIYGVGFEVETPGLDEATRLAGRTGGYHVSYPLLAIDPAFDGIGWAGGGPWSVMVFRSRRLGPADTPALQKALDAALEQKRPNLQRDPALSTMAAEAVANGDVSYEDQLEFGRAGGVPVSLEYNENENYLPAAFLNIRLAKQGPGTLQEAWLRRVGVGATITATGTVVFVVLAAGEADRPALVRELDQAAPQAAELVNRNRDKLGQPKLRLDPGLASAARKALAEATERQCFAIDRYCSAPFPKAAAYFYGRKYPWYSSEIAYTWTLDRRAGDETLTRFGAAATLGPDGLVWSVLLLAA